MTVTTTRSVRSKMMMSLSTTTTAAAVAAVAMMMCGSTSEAFVVVTNSNHHHHNHIHINKASRRSTAFHASSCSADYIIKAGGGIPTTAGGDMEQFDPDQEGKLQGTGSVNSRIQSGPKYQISSGVTTTTSTTKEAQCWLEDIGVPVNIAKPTAPLTATVLGSARIIGQDAVGDIRHIVLKLPPNFHYVEGQSLSVIPPGVDTKTGRAHKPRLYSIASTRYGDLLDGNTVSLCVRRALYYNDDDANTTDDSKQGVCSNFLCDALPNTSVSIAGPIGKTMLLPESEHTDVIMVATGTGIAPFRAFLHRLFMEDTTARHIFQAQAWLILGVPNTNGLLYDEEFQHMRSNTNNNNQFKIDYAISREMTNTMDGGKKYVQHVIAENADDLFQKLDNGANIYFCGLKGMMPPILQTLEQVATDKHLNWNDKLKQWKDNHQWHVEVY